MNTFFRSKVTPAIVLAVLCGCASPPPEVRVEERSAIGVDPFPKPAPAAPPAASLGLEAYKAHVARHIVDRNAAHTFSGRLPPMLPAIVVVSITVDRDGQLTDVRVQRSRDPDASKVALASMQRSAPLPRPDGLLATNGSTLTFSETFLFDRSGEPANYRFQLRTLAGAQ